MSASDRAVADGESLGCVKLAFRDCDVGHARPGSFMRSLVEAATGRPTCVVHPSRDSADLVLASHTQSTWKLARRGIQEMSHRVGVPRDPRQRARSRASRNGTLKGSIPTIWFTLENIRPPVGHWASTFSFDVDTFGGSNTYLPLWWHLLDFFRPEGIDHYLGKRLRVADLLQPRKADSSTRPGFACAFINNPEPMRVRAITELQKVGPVDVFGAMTGRVVPSKIAIASRYKFVLCFENDVYPGYVTEKPVEAWATGAIPLWWGDDAAGYLNPEALINLNNVGTLEGMCDQVQALSTRPDDWERMASLPILRRRPDISPALAAVTRALAMSMRDQES